MEMKKYKINLYLDNKIILTDDLKAYKDILQYSPYILYINVNNTYMVDGIYQDGNEGKRGKIMKVIKEIDSFNDLMENSWSGAIDTLQDIVNANLEEEFMENLENIYFLGETPTDTELNDFIWFERDTIYSDLGLNKNGELEEEF